VDFTLTGLSGVYSEPKHVLLDPDRTVHQQLALDLADNRLRGLARDFHADAR
jgi:hypothetical protein